MDAWGGTRMGGDLQPPGVVPLHAQTAHWLCRHLQPPPCPLRSSFSESLQVHRLRRRSLLFELFRYIHLNPLRAGLVKDLDELDRYPWSGHAVLLGEKSLAGQSTDEVLAFFGKRTKAARHLPEVFSRWCRHGESPGAGRRRIATQSTTGERRRRTVRVRCARPRRRRFCGIAAGGTSPRRKVAPPDRSGCVANNDRKFFALADSRPATARSAKSIFRSAGTLLLPSGQGVGLSRQRRRGKIGDGWFLGQPSNMAW